MGYNAAEEAKKRATLTEALLNAAEFIEKRERSGLQPSVAPGGIFTTLPEVAKEEKQHGEQRTPVYPAKGNRDVECMDGIPS